ncbi:MAG: hypothetical protein A2W36_07045 [Chloroflexi bacterium RBG_16_58_14]|nr:MAG: hypothetical protein A2W36_07045 [Chloroflexi bacterium RBG_16_58_14]
MRTANLAFKLCADFNLFPDNTQLGPNFSLAGFDFAQPPANMLMFVNETAGEKGLQFPKEGMEITLPIPVAAVRLRLGTFAGPVEIAALDSSGAVVRQRIVPGLNAYVNLRMFAPEIATLLLTQGGNEGILVRICVAICVC